MKEQTISLEPNYERVFARFYSVLEGEANELLRQLEKGCRPRTAAEMHREVTFLAFWEHAEATFKAFHDWLGPLGVAFQSALTEEEIIKLRNHVSDVLERVAKIRQEREL